MIFFYTLYEVITSLFEEKNSKLHFGGDFINSTNLPIIQLVRESYHNLSNRQQKVAKYLIEDSQSFAIKSAMEIGNDVGVSETTVIRFCYSLKLNGFTELQKIVRENLILQQSSLKQYYDQKLEIADKPHFYAEVMKQDSLNIQRTIQTINENELDFVVNKIINAKNVLITGKRASYAAAQWLSFSLGLVRENVSLFQSDTDDLVSTISHMNENTVLIAISFHRYLKETIKIAELAKKQNTFVIGITDTILAPISQFSDITLPISQSEKSTLDATPALFSLLNAIVASVSIKDREQFEKRQQQYELIDIEHLFINERGN